MGEQLFKKPAKAASLPTKESPSQTATEAPDVKETLAELQNALGLVEISYGAQTVKYNVSGKTLAYVREALGSMLNLTPEAQAIVNRQPVPLNSEAEFVLPANARVEFIKSSGSKGIY